MKRPIVTLSMALSLSFLIAAGCNQAVTPEERAAAECECKTCATVALKLC